MIEHTPTPWIVIPGTSAIVAADDESIHVATAHFYGGNTETTVPVAKANAAFIVRAVNAHDALVAALEEIDGVMNHLYSEKNESGLHFLPDALAPFSGPLSVISKTTTAALKLAKEGQP